MTGITSTGIGSGLDVNGLVQQLVRAEGQPQQQRLAIRESQFQARLSAFGSLSSSLDTLKGAIEKLANGEATAAREVAVSDEELATASAGNSAVPASYSISIERLATNERLTSSAFTGPDAVVGTGTLTLTVGEAAFAVTLDDATNTLDDIRAAINSAPDNTGVQATIINAEGGSYLVLVGDKTGAENSITVTQYGGDGGLAAITYDPDNAITNLTQSQQALDARAEVNGFLVTSSTNTFDEVIDEVSFTALQPTGTDTFELTVTNDVNRVRGELTALVASYNGFVNTVSQLSSFDPETEVAGALQGDSLLRNLTTQLRRELSEPTASADAGVDTLAEIGISLDETGRLEIDSERLDALLDDNFRAIEGLFGAEDGLVNRVTGLIETFTRSDGLIETRTDGIQSSIDGLTAQNEALAGRLQSLETRLLRQFNGLDSLLAQLNSTSSFLATQLANLPTPGGN